MRKSLIVIGILSLIAIFLAGCGGNNVEGNVVKQTVEETKNSANTEGSNDALAKCLTEKGAIMFGTEWCGHCKNQKAAFGNDFQYIDFVDCDKEKQKCTEYGIRGYPTWVIDAKLYPGEQELTYLANLAGC